MYEDKTIVCKACRDAKRNHYPHEDNTRPMFDAICAECGSPCKVPFEPKNDRPIYCRECYSKHRKETVVDGR